MDHSAPQHLASSSRGLTAIGVFLFFGAAMAFIAGASLVRRGTSLDRMWRLNPHAYEQLLPMGKPAGSFLLLLAVTLALAGTGWLKRQRWGWRLTVVIIGTQVVGDVVNILLGRVVEGVVGVTIAGALLLYVIRPRMRAAFAVKPKQIVRVDNS